MMKVIVFKGIYIEVPYLGKLLWRSDEKIGFGMLRVCTCKAHDSAVWALWIC